MNTLKGHITDLTVDGTLTLVDAAVGDVHFSAIVIDTPDTAAYLKVGNGVEVVFKETEVIIGLPNVEGISLRNRVPGTIQKLQKGDLLSRLELQTDIGTVSSIITTNAVRALELEVGSEVVAMVKTNEVMLSAR